MNFEDISEKLMVFGIEYGLILLKALAIFFIGKFVAKFLKNIINRLMKRSGMDDMLRKFLSNILYAILLTFVVIAAISTLGIQTASLVAVLRTPDKTKIIIPNGQIMSDQIINYTESDVRRMELVVGIGYNDDIDKAREVILEAVKKCEHVVADPAPAVTVAELGDNSVNLAVRPWVVSSKYAPASHELNEIVKKALDAADINIPYPQRDVHIYNYDKA